MNNPCNKCGGTDRNKWGECNPCKLIRHKVYRKANPEKNIRVNPERDRDLRLQREYGITSKDYDNMLSQQGGCCRICGTPQQDFSKPLCVDHCHKTGKVRGILCNSCNSMLGYAKDNLFILENAIEYLMGELDTQISSNETHLDMDMGDFKYGRH